jgi:CRISPR/Cas system CSM-associated protein Csm3 (group 7 of RAMP superfamily)
MRDYKIRIQLLSDVLPGSGEGYGAVIDTDIVFDEVGLPYIPAKRIKGCLRESAHDVCEMLAASSFPDPPIKLSKDNTETDFEIITKYFGSRGQEKSSPFYLSNFKLPEYESNFEALSYFQEKYPNIISVEGVLKFFTSMRQNTAIKKETGTADDHSLRTSRVLKKGIEFEACVQVLAEDKEFEQLLALACLNLRRFGSMRRRGFGEIKCRLFCDNREIRANLMEKK